jgi:hypothetical protein
MRGSSVAVSAVYVWVLLRGSAYLVLVHVDRETQHQHICCFSILG